LRTEVITSLDGFNALQADWNRLLPVDDGIDLPLTWTWFDAWLQGFWSAITRADPRARLHILAFRDDLGIASIAPMAIHDHRYHGFRVLMTHSLANGSTPYWDLVLRPGLDESAVESICSTMFAAAPTAVTLLSRLRDSSPVRRYLARLQRCTWNDLNLIRTPLVRCSGTLETHLESLSKKYRLGLRKKLKTFETTAGTRVERHLLGNSHDPLFDQMVAVSRRSWKSAQGSDLGSYKEHREFLSALVDSLGPLGRAEIWIAYRGNEAIACELHLRSGKVTFPIQADYCVSARALSPGSIVEHHALAAAFEDPMIEVYDSCAADYWYLQRLTDSYRETHNTMVFSSDPRARLIQLAEFGAKPVLTWLRRAFSRAS